MSTNLTVNNNTYAYPSAGDEPGWGEAATGWATEVTEVLNNLQGTDDIPETTFTVADNQTSAADVVGLVFSPTTVRSAVVDYSIYRTNSDTFATSDVDAGADTITITSHVFANGDVVTLSSTDTLPAGLSASTLYYVVGVASNTFQLSATLGGSAIDITDVGVGTHTVSLELAEKGKLELIYKNSAPSTTKWTIGRVFYGDDAGVTFTMTDVGQIQYTSTDTQGSNYTGTMRFEATVTQQ